jgi:hypothetical protein
MFRLSSRRGKNFHPGGELNWFRTRQTFASPAGQLPQRVPRRLISPEVCGQDIGMFLGRDLRGADFVDGFTELWSNISEAASSRSA